MTLTTEDFEALADGTTISAANTNFDLVWGGASIVVDDGDIITPAEGSRCAILSTSSSTAAAEISFTASSDVGARVYYYFDNAPTAQVYIYNAQSGNCQARMTTSMTLQIRTGNVVRATSGTIPTDQWVSFDFFNDGTTYTADIYYTDPDGDTPDETLSTTTSVPSSEEKIILGVSVAGSVSNLGMDNITMAVGEELPTRTAATAYVVPNRPPRQTAMKGNAFWTGGSIGPAITTSSQTTATVSGTLYVGGELGTAVYVPNPSTTGTIIGGGGLGTASVSRSTLTFTPPTYSLALARGKPGSAADMLYRHYGTPIKVGWNVVIKDSVVIPQYAAGPGSITADDIANADTGSGENGKAWFRGGIDYEITQAEYTLLSAAGYTIT